MKLLREYIKKLVSESHFSIYGNDTLRVHHSRPGTRSEGMPQISGFSQKPGRKPNGLWYECQDGSSETWEEFCNLGFGDTKHYENKYDGSYNVILKDGGYNMLIITDEHYFDKFVKMYSIPHHLFPDDPEENIIDWPKVAEHYAGIEICPYLYSKRSMSWYYGWDVASGCVWDPRGIEELVKAGDCK